MHSPHPIELNPGTVCNTWYRWRIQKLSERKFTSVCGVSAECLGISNTQLQAGTEIPTSPASFYTLLLSSDFFFLSSSVLLIFSAVADVACFNKNPLNATSIRKLWIYQHAAWIAKHSNRKTRIQVPGEKKFEPWYLLSFGFHFLFSFEFRRGVLFFF